MQLAVDRLGREFPVLKMLSSVCGQLRNYTHALRLSSVHQWSRSITAYTDYRPTGSLVHCK